MSFAAIAGMILELDDLQNLDQTDPVDQIHRFLGPAKHFLREGGTVVVTKAGTEIGNAATEEELFRLVML